MIITKKRATIFSTFVRVAGINSKMAGDGIVDEAMEIEILPSTSNSDTKIKEKDNKFQNLPWYVL